MWGKGGNRRDTGGVLDKGGKEDGMGDNWKGMEGNGNEKDEWDRGSDTEVMRGGNDGREQAGIERTRHITEFDGAGTKKMNLSTIGQRKFGPGYSSDNAGDGPHYMLVLAVCLR